MRPGPAERGRDRKQKPRRKPRRRALVVPRVAVPPAPDARAAPHAAGKEHRPPRAPRSSLPSLLSRENLEGSGGGLPRRETPAFRFETRPALSRDTRRVERRHFVWAFLGGGDWC